jgi:hypothetical protein
MLRLKIAASFVATIIVGALAAIEKTEDTDLRDLDVTTWDCANESEGTAQSEDAKERNRMKNRWPITHVIPPRFGGTLLNQAALND